MRFIGPIGINYLEDCLCKLKAIEEILPVSSFFVFWILPSKLSLKGIACPAV